MAQEGSQSIYKPSYDQHEMFEPNFPITFNVSLEKRVFPLTITVLQSIPNTFIEDQNPQKVQELLRIESYTHSKLSASSTKTYLVKTFVREAEAEKHGIMYLIKDNVYGLIQTVDGPLQSDVVIRNLHEYVFQNSPFDFIKSWRIEKCIDTTKSNDSIEAQLDTFSMRSPTPALLSPTKSTPKAFLASRYYSTLYSQNTPLSYFPKTALTRFKIMCENPDSIAGVLREICITVERLDERHAGRFGILDKEKVHSIDFQSIELEYKTQFLNRHSHLMNKLEEQMDTRDGEESESDRKRYLELTRVSTELKIRETQLQVVILLELISHRLPKMTEEEFFDKNIKLQEASIKKMQQQTKHNLVRRKKKNKRMIVPTFIGMGVVSKEGKGDAEVETQQQDDSESFIYTTLNSLIDRMSIWDTLLERRGSGDSSLDFLAYVLVPYYNKRIPVTIKYIIDKIKESTLKFTRKSSSNSGSSRSSVSPKKEGKSLNDGISTKAVSHPLSDGTEQQMQSSTSISTTATTTTSATSSYQRSSKYQKTLLRQKRPSLKPNSSSILGDDLLPAFSIKRTKSNVMSSSKNLEKRQVDFSKSFSEADSKSNAANNILEQQPSFIFGNPKKPRASSRSKATNASHKVPPRGNSTVPQVSATPIKKRQNSLEKPSSFVGTAPPYPPVVTTTTKHVERTPNTTRHIILETPEAKTSTENMRQSMYEKLLETNKSEVINGNAIPFIPPSKSIVASSPTSPNIVVASSPAKDHEVGISSIKRMRPGDPIPAQASPFFGSNFQGSPISTKKVDSSDEDEEDSDYERMAKRIHRSTQKKYFDRAPTTY